MIMIIFDLQDADNKKSEKKEVVGPPLQTASVSVRALIEEKIIQKRTTGRFTLAFGILVLLYISRAREATYRILQLYLRF